MVGAANSVLVRNSPFSHQGETYREYQLDRAGFLLPARYTCELVSMLHLTAGAMRCVLEVESTEESVCAGRSAGRSPARCIYATSVIVRTPLSERSDSPKGSGSFREDTFPEGFSSKPLAASFGHRAEANNVVPAQTGLGQSLSVASEASQVSVIWCWTVCCCIRCAPFALG